MMMMGNEQDVAYCLELRACYTAFIIVLNNETSLEMRMLVSCSSH